MTGEQQSSIREFINSEGARLKGKAHDMDRLQGWYVKYCDEWGLPIAELELTRQVMESEGYAIQADTAPDTMRRQVEDAKLVVRAVLPRTGMPLSELVNTAMRAVDDLEGVPMRIALAELRSEGRLKWGGTDDFPWIHPARRGQRINPNNRMVR